MSVLSALRCTALVLLVTALLAGCDGLDSGVPPSESAQQEPGPTIAFEQENVSITEENSPLTIGVTLTNPPGTEVSAEILYANGVSQTDASDFNLPQSAAVGEGNGYLAGEVTFSADAEEGATRSIELDIMDGEENEDREDGTFVLQGVEGATIGSPDRFTASIGAIEIFFKDFQDEELDPMTVVDVTNGNGWGLGSNDGNFFAAANAFGGSEASNSWVITPDLNFNDFEDETLTFRNAKNFDDEGLEEPLQVKVSTDYDGSGNPENFTWTDITDRVENFSEGGYNFVSSGEIDLSDAQFQAEEVYVAFQYQSSGTGGGSSEAQQVDDVRIVGR